jgi:hypothetical protein
MRIKNIAACVVRQPDTSQNLRKPTPIDNIMITIELRWIYPAERREGPASLQKRGFAACLNEIAAAHPEAQRFEIWSQDEARVGQKGRTGYVWWQRGHTPRGRRDIGYQSAWIIGAVCPVWIGVE